LSNGHTCNAWCFGGVHAVLFDTEISDRGALDAVAKNMAGYVGTYLGHMEIAVPGQAAPGTPTQRGVARGRCVAWALRQ
jgi:hypothetical protein